METVNVSVCQKYGKYNINFKEQDGELFRERLVLTGFELTENGDINKIKYGYNEYIKAIFRVYKGANKGLEITHLIPISGESSSYGRKIIRSIMEASGFAKRGDFHSYSIKKYEDLINLRFPAYIKNKEISSIINDCSDFSNLDKENSYGL